MSEKERAEGRREGKGDHEVRYREQPVELFGKPLAALRFPANRTVAVATGAVNVEQLPALIARAGECAERFGAAVGDGVNDRAMPSGNGISAGGTIGGAVGAKDFSESGHGRPPRELS